MDLKEIQQALKDYGFYTGAVDGDFGDKSRASLMTALKAALAHSASADLTEDDAALMHDLDQDEGVVAYAYPDSRGYLTIGRGRMVDKRRGGGISRGEIDFLSMNDFRKVDAQLDAGIPWWRGLDPVRRRALRNLCFNMGWDNPATPEKEGLSGFVNGSLEAMRVGDYDRAALGFSASKWAKQVQPARRDRIIRQIRTGA